MAVALAYRAIGEAYTYMDQYEEGLTYLKLFRDISKSEKDLVEVQRALTAIGWCYLEFAKFLEKQWDYEGRHEPLKENFQDAYKKAEKFSRLAYTAVPEDQEICVDKEQKEMKTAVLMNRGYALMSLKKYECAENCFKEACDIAKSYSTIYDRYYANLLLHLTTISVKQLKFSNGLKLNKDIMNTLEKLPVTDAEKQVIHTEALTQKIQILLGLRQFQQAKKLTKSLFIRNGGKIDDPLAKSLKTVIKICHLLEEINKNDIDDHLTVKNYEQIGDLCVSLERYDTANFYYEKAVDIAESLGGAENKVLGALYFSIAENYCDLEDFEKAEVYYAKKLETCRQDAKESCQITLRLAKCSYLSGKELTETNIICDQARKLAIRSGRPALEARVLQVNYIYHTKYNSSSCDIIKLELERFVQQYDLETNELEIEENDQEELVSEASEEFNIDTISEEDEEDSDNELKCLGSGLVKSGRKRGVFKPTTNSKGETDLHIKCQEDGNLDAIQTLIKMGHPLNIADRAKFTPIHEACNYGFLEYVKVLHSLGAKLNLKSNSGVTPLITACSNGSIDIVEYLVESGALVHIQEECGWTAKDHLLHYYRINRAEIDTKNHERFKSVINKMNKGMKGYELLPKKPISTVFETEGEQNLILGQNDFLHTKENESYSENRLSRSRRKLANNRYKPDFRKTQELSSQNSPNSETSSSIKTYVEAVSSVKNRRLIQPKLNLVTHCKDNNAYTQPLPSKKSFNSCHQNLSEDDWLEDDMPKLKKSIIGNKKTLNIHEKFKDAKRQRLDASDVNPIYKPTVQKQYAFNKFVSEPSKHISNTLEIERPVMPYPITSTQVSTIEPSITNVELQESLDTVQPLPHAPSATRNINEAISISNTSNVLRFYVQIEERRLLIPISKESRVSELSKAVLQRYRNTNETTASTGRMPVIKLLDNEGCELDDGDLLIDLFGGTSGPIRLQSRVDKWELEDIEAVYEKLCQDMNLLNLPGIKQALAQCQRTTQLNLSRSIIRSKSSQPVFRALRHRSILTEINLAGNKLGIDPMESKNRRDDSLICMEELGASIKTLNCLTKLDLSSNALHSYHLKAFANSLLSPQTGGLDVNDNNIMIKEINLGFNFFGDDCNATVITLIEKCLLLETLCLSSCGLSKNFFIRNYKEWENVFHQNEISVKNIDISHNPKLEVVGIDKMLQLLDPNIVRSLDISSCCNSSNINEKQNLGEVLFKYASRGRPDIALQDLNISNNLSVSLEDFLNSLYHMSHLRKLNLSYCNGLTLYFVANLFEELWNQSSKCEEIQIFDSFNMWSNEGSEVDLVQKVVTNIEYLASSKNLRTLQLSINDTVTEESCIHTILIAWHRTFNENSNIQISGKKLKLSVIKCQT